MLYMEALFGFLGRTNHSTICQRVTATTILRHDGEQMIKISEKYTATKCGVHSLKAMHDFVLKK
jgi:hypothetical protein